MSGCQLRPRKSRPSTWAQIAASRDRLATPAKWSRRLVSPLRVRFPFHLQDVSPEPIEFLFKGRQIERVLAVGHLQSDVCPVLWAQHVERSRKQDALLHGHVLPFVVDEVANDAVHGLAQKIVVAQDALDRLGDPAQTPRSLPMLGIEIAYGRRCDRIARL